MTVNAAVEFNPNLAARASRTVTLVKIDERFDLANIHGRFELNKFILPPRRGSVVLVIISFRRTDMLEKQCLRARTRSGVEIEIDSFLPANADFHRANHDRRRRLSACRQGVAREPISHSQAAANPQHLYFPLRGINGPMLSRTRCTRMPKRLQGNGHIASEGRQLRPASFEVERPKSCDLFFVQIADPRIAKINPVKDQRRRNG